MDKININEIDLSLFEKSKNQGTTSTVYFDGDRCIKMLDDFSEEEKDLLYKKFLDMDGIKIAGVLMPKSLILKDDILQGYIMDNFKNSINLYDYFGNNRFINSNELFNILIKVSSILRNVHENDIIIQDLTFDNILVNKDGTVMFCDIDSCRYKEHHFTCVSQLLKEFMVDYRKQILPFDENLDRISIMISLFYFVYFKEIQNLSYKKYHSLSDQIKTLDNLRESANILRDRTKEISYIPYLDEVIDEKDDYIIDRYKQLSIKGKILTRLRIFN